MLLAAAAAMGHGAKKWPPLLPSVKLSAPESSTLMIPVTWLGSSSTLSVVNETDRGGPQPPPFPGPLAVLIDPFTTSTWTCCPLDRPEAPVKLSPAGKVKPLASTEKLALLAMLTAATPPRAKPV